MFRVIVFVVRKDINFWQDVDFGQEREKEACM